MKEKNADRLITFIVIVIAIILLAIGVVYNMTCGDTIFDALDDITPKTQQTK